MSEEFEKLKNEVNGFRQAAENKIELEKRAEEERIRRNKLILEKTGVRQLFEEIRDNRLVESRPPRRDKIQVDRSFGRIGWEEKIKYYPASIELNAVKYNNDYCATCLSLRFNDRSGGRETEYETVIVAVVGEELCLVEPKLGPSNSSLFMDTHSFTPIKEGELAMTIAKALKNPIKVDSIYYSGFPIL